MSVYDQPQRLFIHDPAGSENAPEKTIVSNPQAFVFDVCRVHLRGQLTDFFGLLQA
jgi:hypothetical protein